MHGKNNPYKQKEFLKMESEPFPKAFMLNQNIKMDWYKVIFWQSATLRSPSKDPL